MITDFANILSLAPKATPRNTFTNVALDNAAKYGELLKWNQEALPSAAARKQDLDFDREKLDLDRKRVDAEIKINNSAGRRQGKGAAALALLAPILEQMTGSGKRRESERFAGQLFKAYGSDLDPLTGFDNTIGTLGSIRQRIDQWNPTPDILRGVNGQAG